MHTAGAAALESWYVPRRQILHIAIVDTKYFPASQNRQSATSSCWVVPPPTKAYRPVRQFAQIAGAAALESWYLP